MMSSTPQHNARSVHEQHGPGLPFAVLIHEDGDIDSHLATAEMRGDTLLLEFDDGRTVELDFRELLDRAVA